MSINYGINEKEFAVLKAFEESPVLTLKELSAIVSSGNSDNTSGARNSLRKPVKHGFVAKVGRGRYELTPKRKEFNGSVLREARIESGMSQNEVALALGCGRQRVGDFETGRKKPQVAEIYAIAKVFKAKISSFFPASAVVEAEKVEEVSAAG